MRRMTSPVTPEAPFRISRPNCHDAHAAMKTARFVSVFTGSPQSPGPVRSQYRSMNSVTSVGGGLDFKSVSKTNQVIRFASPQPITSVWMLSVICYFQRIRSTKRNRSLRQPHQQEDGFHEVVLLLMLGRYGLHPDLLCVPLDPLISDSK